VVVFDFVSSDGNEFGRKLAESVRLRLRRHHKEYEVIDHLTTAEASGPLGIEADEKKVIDLMRNRVGSNLGVYGTADFRGQAARAEVRIVDLTGKEPKVARAAFSEDSERAAGEVARRIVEALRGQGEWAPPEYGDEPEPKREEFGPPVSRNGAFEDGHAGWEPPDNAGTFLEPGPAGRGKVLRLRTDIERDKWLEYRRKLAFGLADPTRPPELKRDTSYGSVAGLEGIHYRSDWIDASPGQRYWLLADMKGKSEGIFFPMIYVKGFLDWSDRADALPEASLIERKLTAEQFAKLPPEGRRELVAVDAKAHPDRYRRECFRWFLACRNPENVWLHYAAPFPPRGGLPANVRWLRVEVYAYWPPMSYYFDDVHVYKDPRQKAPLPEEKPRTPNFGKQAEDDDAAGGE